MTWNQCTYSYSYSQVFKCPKFNLRVSVCSFQNFLRRARECPRSPSISMHCMLHNPSSFLDHVQNYLEILTDKYTIASSSPVLSSYHSIKMLVQSNIVSNTKAILFLLPVRGKNRDAGQQLFSLIVVYSYSNLSFNYIKS